MLTALWPYRDQLAPALRRVYDALLDTPTLEEASRTIYKDPRLTITLIQQLELFTYRTLVGPIATIDPAMVRREDLPGFQPSPPPIAWQLDPKKKRRKYAAPKAYHHGT